MKNTSKDYLNKICKELNEFDWFAVSITCTNLIEDIFTKEIVFEIDDFHKIMKQLRRKRRFALMVRLGDALSITSRTNFSIRNLYAQSLIEQGYFTSGISVLEKLELEMKQSQFKELNEYFETQGILGRAYKQLFIRTGYSKSTTSINFLEKSIKYYIEVYKNDTKNRTWHGINAVALLAMANRHEIPSISYLGDYTQLANEILSCIEGKEKEGTADAWDFATAAECCLALKDFDESLKWLAGYSSQEDCDAFELASTLRQFEEIWELSMDEKSGQILMPLLRAELLKRSGGEFEMDPEDIRKELAVAKTVTSQYESMVDDSSKSSSTKLEKVFGMDSFKTYKWYMQGAARCLAVARIGLDSSRGEGTGFLIKGNSLHASLGEELFLLTNSHVVSDDLLEKALSPEEAIVIFEVLDSTLEFRLNEIIWSSPSTELDACLASFSAEDQEKLLDLTKDVDWYPLSNTLPVMGMDQKVYIIGHPRGGTLQLSFQDNHLLDHQDPLIHYRTPTDNGSSGSPIFNRTWMLLGLHHAGGDEMKCLNDKGGVYSANEGIYIQAIIASIAEKLGPKV
ncbi:MAG: serine protease [Chryseobacterium sp.]|jgi:hypothetical protein|uniref:serine protease n=1 Tax=Chryseobacterium sp. TaxID=1871047 RepID=UPI00283921EC|nr:serine protease [Chryseobacterium sp.]MDR2234691.1 serine protease [Chryseobacterium sp.]